MNTPSFLTEPAPALSPALSLDLPAAPRRRPRPGEGEARRREGPPSGSSSAPAPPEEGGRSTWRAVYTIVERGGGRRLWLRIGTAFINRDQSLNVRLDAMPVNGQLHIREAPPPGVPPVGGEREPARDGPRPDPSAPSGSAP